jgi:hypothetical protein
MYIFTLSIQYRYQQFLRIIVSSIQYLDYYSHLESGNVIVPFGAMIHIRNFDL